MITRSVLLTLAIAATCALLLRSIVFAQDASTQLMEMMRQLQTQSAIEDEKVYRPSPQEREAVGKLIDMKPRAKTYNDADIGYLKALFDKPVWLGSERRIMHEMWTEVTGKQWETSGAEISKPAKPSK
jgi:hypothetical protein